jgi:hypothetical protein
LTTDLLAGEQADPDNAGVRREATLPSHEEITLEQPTPPLEFAFAEDTSDEDLLENETLRKGMIVPLPSGSLLRSANHYQRLRGAILECESLTRFSLYV